MRRLSEGDHFTSYSALSTWYSAETKSFRVFHQELDYPFAPVLPRRFRRPGCCFASFDLLVTARHAQASSHRHHPLELSLARLAYGRAVSAWLSAGRQVASSA